MNRTADQLRETYKQVTDEYFTWLQPQSRKLAQKWSGDLKSEQGVEGAIVEAWSANFLRTQVEEVRMAEDERTGGADFECSQFQNTFHVEATCLTISTVKKHYWCDDIMETGGAVGSL